MQTHRHSPYFHSVALRRGEPVLSTHHDEFLYDEMQQALVWALAHEIRSGLAQAKLSEPLIQALTKHLTARLINVLDGRKALYAEGQNANVSVAFKVPKGLLVDDGMAQMSQHVALTLEALFTEALS
jgi:hypothetical protein